jgi:hypothetical protein
VEALTQVHHGLQKQVLLAGISRTYQPKDDDGDQLPPESTRVQLVAEDKVDEVRGILTKLYDIVATKDYANTEARADIIVDGKVLLGAVPTTYLLFLEKALVDLHTVIKKLPTLDPAESWARDTTTGGAYRTEPTRTVKTKKVPKNWVKAEATDKHPAQVEIFHEDVMVGTWTTVKFSGAMPQDRVNELLDRVETLQQAVKFAREEANTTEVKDVKVGETLFNYLFA